MDDDTVICGDDEALAEAYNIAQEYIGDNMNYEISCPMQMNM